MTWMGAAARAIEILSEAEVVVGMPMRNMAATVERSAESVLRQEGVRGRLVLLVADDDSSDDGPWKLRSLGERGRLVVIRGRFGAAWAVRNFILRVIERHARRCSLVLRLDADDVMEERGIVRSVEASFRRMVSFRRGFRRSCSRALLAGNSLALRGQQLARLNLPCERLAHPSGLMERLAGMASGDPLAELPSCNLVLRPGGWRYPAVASAEDHWLTARVLLGREVRIEQELVYCRYSLSGAVTRRNRAELRHQQARVSLFQAVAARLYGGPGAR
jgi:glycosyltransferase involved in cell wall biosynthesis